MLFNYQILRISLSPWFVLCVWVCVCCVCVRRKDKVRAWDLGTRIITYLSMGYSRSTHGRCRYFSIQTHIHTPIHTHTHTHTHTRSGVDSFGCNIWEDGGVWSNDTNNTYRQICRYVEFIYVQKSRKEQKIVRKRNGRRWKGRKKLKFDDEENAENKIKLRVIWGRRHKKEKRMYIVGKRKWKTWKT